MIEPKTDSRLTGLLPKTGSGRPWQIFTVVLLVVGVAWIFASRMPPDNSYLAQAVIGPQIGLLAPDFSLASTDGRTVTLSELQGTPVIVNFWATWCPPCRDEMPELEKLWREQGGGRELMLLGVNQGERIDTIERFRAQVANVTFPILLDLDMQVAQTYTVQALPTTYFIDANGRIQDVKIGGPMDQAMLLDGVNKILEP